ncbi:VWA domain-containing protein [Apibacter muscae]|nr:VWA domain-containing protein [Apibacter muscae]
MMLTNMEFANSWVLILLLIVPLFTFLKYRKRKKQNTIFIPNLSKFSREKTSIEKLRPVCFWLRLCTIFLLIVALARPRKVHVSEALNKNKGIDIMLTVDVSISMLAKDLDPDRLTALKRVAINFVKNRPVDRIGLIAYAGEALTLVPLTIDRNILIEQMEALQTQTLEGDTAIGVGLATAVSHLKESKTKSKVVILMTDGVDNDGFIKPLMAADIAKKYGIKVYTIGVGSNGLALYPTSMNPYSGEIFFEQQKVEIDEDLLKEIAQKTGGEYFRATDAQSLQDIYDQINRLEKSEINNKKHYNYTEKYRLFLIPAFIILLIELLLRGFVFKSIA